MSLLLTCLSLAAPAGSAPNVLLRLSGSAVNPRYRISKGWTGRDGTGRDGTGRDGTGRDGTGRDGTGRDGTGRDGTGRDGTGRDGTGRDGTGRDGTGRDGTGRDGTGRDGTGRKLEVKVGSWKLKSLSTLTRTPFHWMVQRALSLSPPDSPVHSNNNSIYL